MQTTLEIAMREVGRAYNEETRNLNFLSTVELTVKEAIAVLKKHVPSYNEFTPKLLAKLPHDSLVRIGRAGSPVIYVTSQFQPSQDTKADELDLHCWQGDKQVWRLWWD